jgi:hypothetical protein
MPKDDDDLKSPRYPSLTGTRNDDSSLFSLDKLRQAEENATRSSAKDRDDSGLIDLQALASLASSPPSHVDNAPLIVSAGVGLFGAPPVTAPFESPAAAPDLSGLDERAFKSGSKRRTMFVALGAVGAVAVAAVAFFAMQGSEAPPVGATAALVSTAVTAAPPPTTPPAPPPPPEPAQVAAVVPGQRAPAAVAPTPPVAPVAPVAASKPVAARRPASDAAPKAPAEPKDTKPAAPACDLTCQMQRAVSKGK